MCDILGIRSPKTFRAHSRNYEIINNELISYVEFYENNKPKKRL